MERAKADRVRNRSRPTRRRIEWFDDPDNFDAKLWRRLGPLAGTGLMRGRLARPTWPYGKMAWSSTRTRRGS
jgi:hypothetical protein